jgi:hypothetical protein
LYVLHCGFGPDGVSATVGPPRARDHRRVRALVSECYRQALAEARAERAPIIALAQVR